MIFQSLPYIAAIEQADTAIGIFLDKLKAKGLYDNTHFILITDHVGIKNWHGGITMTEMQAPRGITGPRIKRMGLSDFYNSNKNTSLLIARIFAVKDKSLPGSRQANCLNPS